MSDLNNFSVIGRITKDAELKTIGAKQTPCAEFTIANNTGYGQFEKTSFISVQLWGTSATNLVPYLRKGTRVAACGEFTQNDWVDTNGVKHSMWRLSSRSVQLLGAPSSQGQQGAQVSEPSIEDTTF